MRRLVRAGIVAQALVPAVSRLVSTLLRRRHAGSKASVGMSADAGGKSACATPLLMPPCILASLLAAAPPTDDWPQFRGNPQLTGVAAGPVPTTLKLLWTYDAGESIESSAAIPGGTVYVDLQSKDLLAIDLATGK